MTDLQQDCLKLSPIPARVLTAPAVLDRLSHDFYWYSPVLRPLLVSKNGDVAVQPVSVDEVLAVLRFAGEHEVPVTCAARAPATTASAFRLKAASCSIFR
jgi:FAD/FMN-containing dehydrogenase